nr:MAG TPA: hypothetical protein [Caudoviricetes sp.]
MRQKHKNGYTDKISCCQFANSRTGCRAGTGK